MSQREHEGLRAFVFAVQKTNKTSGSVMGQLANASIYLAYGAAAYAMDPQLAMAPTAFLTSVYVMSRILTKPGGGKLLATLTDNVTRFPGQPSKWGLFGASRLGEMIRVAAREEARNPLGATEPGAANPSTPAP